MKGRILGFSIFLLLICFVGQGYTQGLESKISYKSNSILSYFKNNSFPIEVFNDNAAFRLDSLISKSLPETLNKIVFRYNENNLISEWSYYSFNKEVWEIDFNNELYYDSEGNKIKEVALWFDSDTLSFTTYQYSNGMLKQRIDMTYDIDSNSLINSTKDELEYNVNNLLSHRLVSKWNDNQWNDSQLISFSYLEDGGIDSILFQNYFNNQWKDDVKTLYYYSESGEVDSIVVKTWYSTKWINTIKQISIEDSTLRAVEQITQNWEGNEWQNYEKISFTFNTNNKIESANSKIWSNNQWVKNNGWIILNIEDNFNLGLYSYYVNMYYSELVGSVEDSEYQISDYNLSQNYPNPFNPSTIINYSIPQQDFVEIKIFDVLGKEITKLVSKYQHAGQYQVEFNASNLPSGIYFYRIKVGRFIETRKMILLK